jgi:hypothetical protein
MPPFFSRNFQKVLLAQCLDGEHIVKVQNEVSKRINAMNTFPNVTLTDHCEARGR